MNDHEAASELATVTRPAGARGSVPVVGMVGAGQLARMTCQAAIGLGIGFRVLAAASDESAAQVCAASVLGDYRSMDDLMAFGAQCDVLTFDHEHVPGPHLNALERAGLKVQPGPDALRFAQDKSAMRERLAGLGIAPPRDAPPVPAHGIDLMVEEHVAFERELAVLVARSPSGQGAAYPVVQTVQRDGICREVLAPAPGLPDDTAVAAERLGLAIAAGIGVTGLLAVELFETPGGLLVNELAMRPHNSGHWTIEGARTSQFEQHLRAVLGLPLGAPVLAARHAVMVNILGGADPDLYSRLVHVMADHPGVKVHLYGKEVRPGRKVGHVTAVGDDIEDLRDRAARAANYLRHGTEDE